MALEKWLLEDVALNSPTLLESTLLRLVCGSCNIAITAVAASVANVHPSRCGKIVTLLLKTPPFIHVDRVRWMNDTRHAGWHGGWFSENQQFLKERLRSNELPHRKESIEQTILKAQFGAARTELWAVLDGYYAALAAEVEQETEETRVFRLLLHRIDARNLIPQPSGEGTNRILFV